MPCVQEGALRGQRVRALAVLFMILFLKHYSLSSQLQDETLMRNTVKLGQELKNEFGPIEDKQRETWKSKKGIKIQCP